MTTPQPTALALSRVFLWILIGFNLFGGLLAIICLPASFAFEPMFIAFFTKKAAGAVASGMMMPVLRVWMVLALAVIATVHVLLTRLLAMVETVREGDPFVPENAARLKTIAWCLLGGQVFELISGVMARLMNEAGSNIVWSSSGASGWLAVVLVFVLARVFEEGTSLRADLKAMI